MGFFSRQSATNSGAERAAGADPVEVALVEQILAGDHESFAAIVARFEAPLVTLAWRYTHDRARAEELAQEAFLRVWRNLGSWRKESALSSWVFAVAANLYRSELKRIPTETLPLEEAPEPAREADQYSSLATNRRDDRIRAAVLALPLRYREPVILYYFREMDLEAAAASLNLPPGTMKARLSRARDLLRRRFPSLAEEALELVPERSL